MTFILSLKPELTWHESPGEASIVLQTRGRKLTFNQPTTGLKLALKALHNCQENSKKQFNHLVQQTDSIGGLFNFNSYLIKLINLG